jgi:protein-disulfide isomerase
MQYIIGGVAIVVIAAIIVVGLVIHGSKTKVQAAGYGDSVSSTATVNGDGIITVSHGDPDLVLDIYEDAICPFCAQLEHQYGQQISQAIDDGKLIVKYHMVNMLDSHSKSGTYSTRAYAAMIAVATNDGSDPGVLLNFHASLFNQANQQEEVGSGGTSDLSYDDLADLAKAVGASDKTQQQISDGKYVDKAKSDGDANLDSLKKVAAKNGTNAGTPTVVKDGVTVDTSKTNWLTNLLPAGYTPTVAKSNQTGQGN